MAELNFTPFPNLTTGRLKLRQLRIGDENEIMFLRTDERVNQFLGREKPKVIGDVIDFIKKVEAGVANNERLYWVITIGENNAVIGTICLFNIDAEKDIAEIGYELNPAFHGKGIMQEAIVAVIDFAFNSLKLKTITAASHVANDRSIKLLERNNFQPDKAYEYMSQEDLGNLICYFLKHSNQ